MSWTVMMRGRSAVSSIVGGREGANDGVVTRCVAGSRFAERGVTSPQLSDAVASSIGISSEHSTV